MKKQKKMVDPPETINNINIINGNTSTTTSSTGNKRKSKKVITVKKEVISEKETSCQGTAALAAEEKSRDGQVGGATEEGFPMAAMMAEMVVDDGIVDGTDDWRTWLRPGALVDEQMSWGSVWYEVDANYSCHAFYGDVLEEDDIWDLRSPKT